MKQNIMWFEKTLLYLGLNIKEGKWNEKGKSSHCGDFAVERGCKK